jgi:hypothetical protein
MMFRHATCVLCGKVPPSNGFAELPAEQQPKPMPPTLDEMTRLWAQRSARNGRCPRCYRSVGMHLVRIVANRALLGTMHDTTLARQLKVPVVMVRNVRGALEVPGLARKHAGHGQKLSPEHLAVYRNGWLCNVCAAKASGANVVSVRIWRSRHLDLLDCPPPPDPIPPEFFDPALADTMVADLTGCVPGTVWKWRRMHRQELRPMLPEARARIRARYREWSRFAGRRYRRHCLPVV